MDEQADSGMSMPKSTWKMRYARRLAITDLLVIAWVVGGVQIARYGLDPSSQSSTLDATSSTSR